MRLKLTKAGRMVVFLLVAAIVVGGCFVGHQYLPDFGFGGSDDESISVPETTLQNSDSSGIVIVPSTNKTEVESDEETINLSLDEWIGWKPIIDANGGLTTKPGSIFDNLGIKVNIHVINDGASSSNALIKGDLDAAGYTLNRAAFLSNKFASENFDVVMPIFTNYSDGGDGIIALNEFNSIESLVDAKIGVPKFSEAQSMVVWFVNKSDLSDAEKQKILDNLILLDDAEQTGQAFFSGNLDVAATWQPYLSNAENSTNSHILFDTTSSNRLIMDGILFSKDFAEENRETVSAFIEGIFEAESLYTTEFDAIREVMPMFADASDEDILGMCGDAGLMNYHKNMKALTDDCPILFEDMCNIWESIGETTDHELGKSLFDTSYLMALEDKYNTIDQTEVPKFEVTEEQKEAIKDFQALLSKSATVNFVSDTSKFLDTAEANAILKEFVDIAKILDGTIIQIEGNINSSVTNEEGQRLSEERAKTVKNFFVMNGIDPNRIIVVGNGNTKMVVDPSSEDATLNRRTDVFFKTIEE